MCSHTYVCVHNSDSTSSHSPLNRPRRTPLLPKRQGKLSPLVPPHRSILLSSLSRFFISFSFFSLLFLPSHLRLLSTLFQFCRRHSPYGARISTPSGSTIRSHLISPWEYIGSLRGCMYIYTYDTRFRFREFLSRSSRWR